LPPSLAKEHLKRALESGGFKEFDPTWTISAFIRP